MKELKKLVAEYRKVSDKLDAVETAWDADCENEELEKQFDSLYAVQYEIYQKLTKAIVDAINIDEDIAKRMIVTKFDGLESIARMIA